MSSLMRVLWYKPGAMFVPHFLVASKADASTLFTIPCWP